VIDSQRNNDKEATEERSVPPKPDGKVHTLCRTAPNAKKRPAARRAKKNEVPSMASMRDPQAMGPCKTPSDGLPCPVEASHHFVVRFWKRGGHCKKVN